ncbi:MAG: PAS domain S-box protein [Gammaproteobacteria bacterium]
MSPVTRDRLDLQAVLDAAVEAVILIDESGKIETFNRSAERLFGWTAAEALGRNVSMLMDGGDRAGHDGYIRRFLSTGEAKIIGIGREVSARRKDGSIFPAMLAVGEVQQSHPRRFVGFLHDITVRKQALEALSKSEALLRAAQGIARLGNFELPLDGPGIAVWSAEVANLLGVPPDALPPDLPGFIQHHVVEDDRVRFDREWRRAAAEYADLETVCRILRGDGEVRSLDVRVQFGQQGAARVATGTLHDVTERKRAEEAARQSEARLTHFARLSTMGEMAAGLAHEINQPLTAIATFAQAATRMLARPEGIERADLEETLQQVTAQALRAGEVIRRLRAFVKNREVRHEAVDCLRLVEESRLLLEADARSNDVVLVVDMPESLPPINADPVQLQQVLINLVRNAIDATVATGNARREVTIIGCFDPGDVPVVEFAVIDHGHGLSTEAAERLFHPFYTTKPTGTGLGLAISQSIIRAHGGRLGYRPTPGGGCTFHFTLPALGAMPGGEAN